MSIFHTIILGFVEGLTEFLPVSSTGHLILASKLLQIPTTEFQKSFEIFIQLGAILAVVGIYFKALLNRKLWLPIILGFIPTAVVGVTLYPLIKNVLLDSANIVLWSLALGGLAIIVIELLLSARDARTQENTVTPKQALIIGTVQALAVIPGVSRAAAAIIGGRLVGLSRRAAVEFSFLLAVPTIFAATGYDLFKSHLTFTSSDYQIFALGFIVAFLTALVAVKSFLRLIQTQTLVPFGVYRIIIALVFFLIFFI